MKKIINIFLAVTALLVFSCSCNSSKDKRDLFPVIIATNTDLISNSSDNNTLPKEIIEILRPVNLDNCNQQDISKYWKANAQLIRLELKEQKYIQISPQYKTDLVPSQDSSNFMNAVLGFKLTDDIFSKKKELDSNYFSKNLNNLLQANQQALKIIYNSEDTTFVSSKNNLKIAHNIAQVKDFISSYLCSDTTSKKVIVFYKFPSNIKKPDTVATEPPKDTTPKQPVVETKPTVKLKQTTIKTNKKKKPINTDEIDLSNSKSDVIKVKKKDIKN